MTPTPAIEKKLVTKLSEVMNEVGRLPKSGTNTHFNYKFVRESDLVEKLSSLLAERHIFITSSTKGIETVELSKILRTGEVVVAKMGVLRVEYTFHDGDTGETLTMESVGEIDQDGGKGLYKALTGAMKYFLMKNFLVATGDDPEQDAGHKQEKAAPAAPAPKAKAAPAKKAKPTTTMVMEAMSATKFPGPLDKIYAQALTHDWTKQELADLAECYLNNYHRVMGWLRKGMEFVTAEGAVIAIATITDGRAVVTAKPAAEPAPAPKPATRPTAEEIAAAEDAARLAA